MAIKVKVSKHMGSKEAMVKMYADKYGVTADWMTPAYARRLAARLLKAADRADIVIFMTPKKKKKIKDADLTSWPFASAGRE